MTRLEGLGGSMKTNDKPFLSSYISDFKIGDLIYWAVYEQDEGFSVTQIVKHGAIIDIKKKTFGFDSREVYYAIVLPFGNSQTVELALHLLRKQTN